jgi:O-antigen/teichoic acid export membrane protein
MTMPEKADIQFKTIFLSTVARIFYKIATLVIITLVAKRLGPENLGNYYFVIAFLSILIVAARFGVAPVVIRKLSRERPISLQYMSNVLGFQILTLLLSFGISLILGISLQLNVRVVVLCFLYLGLESIYTVLSSLFLAHEKVKYNILIGVSTKTLLIILILMNLGKLTLLNFIYIQLLANIFLVGFALVITITKFGATIPDFDYRNWRSLVKESSPFLMIEICSILLLRMDSIALGLFSTLRAVGYFGVVLALKRGFELFPEGLQLILLPQMSKLHREKQQLHLLYRKYQIIYLGGGILLAVLASLFAKTLIIEIFGSAFQSTIFAFRLVLITIPIMFLYAINRMLLTATNKEKQYLSFSKKMVIAKSVLILAVIPHYGYLGAVIVLVLLDIATLFYTQLLALRIFTPSTRVASERSL